MTQLFPKTYSLPLLSLLLFGCSASSTLENNEAETITTEHSNSAQIEHDGDPLEGVNRSIWDFNYNYLDKYIFRPVSVTYVSYTPSILRKGIVNVLGNLDEPSSMVNNLIMGNGTKAVDHFNRFWINSTIGIFGIFDVASEVGIPNHGEKSFNNALGHYGVGQGAFIMAPGYGPTSVRGTTELVDDLYFPLSYFNIWGNIGRWTLGGLEARAAMIPFEPQLNNSPDPYALVRETYLQHEKFAAEIESSKENVEEEDFLDSYLAQGEDAQ